MIKVVLLDMGGVLVKEAGKEQINLLAEYSGLDFGECKRIRKKYWSLLKVGKITDEEYWLGAKDIHDLEKGLLAELGISQDKYSFLRKASIELIEPFDDAQEFLEKLSEHFVLILLSNNSYDWGENVLQELGFEKYFHSLIFSHNIGYAKPGKEMFEIALKEVTQENNEILFIDDKEKNFAIPEEVGIQTHLFKDYENIYSLLNIK